MTAHQIDINEAERPHAHRIAAFAFFRGLAAFALLGAGLLIAASPASAAETITQTAAAPVSADHTLAATTLCNNGVGGGGGQGVICEVTVVNTITNTGGSAVVAVHECIGSAGDPTDGVCSTTTLNLTEPVTRVEQCNGTVEGGGSTLRCSVVITNNFVGVSPGSAGVTVNECVGSGAGGGTVMTCDPIEATTDATITQCNGTGNGGGASITCTATGQVASALPVTIDQCNGSANDGGSLVVCSASMTNTTGSTPPPTSTVSQGSSNNSIPPLTVLLIGLAFAGLGLVAVEWRRWSVRS